MTSVRHASDADGVLEGLASRDDFATVIVPAMRADMMRALQFAAVAAICMRLNGQSMVAATHTLARRRGLSFGDGHGGSLFPLYRPTPRAAKSAASGIDNVYYDQAGGSSRPQPRSQARPAFYSSSFAFFCPANVARAAKGLGRGAASSASISSRGTSSTPCSRAAPARRG